MHAIIAFLQAHPTTSTLVAYYIASAFIGALPAPQATSGMFYNWFYKFLNTLGGNLSRAFATRVEGSPNWAPAVQKAKDLGALPGDPKP
jgi:hypothetical protein